MKRSFSSGVPLVLQFLLSHSALTVSTPAPVIDHERYGSSGHAAELAAHDGLARHTSSAASRLRRALLRAAEDPLMDKINQMRAELCAERADPLDHKQCTKFMSDYCR